MTKEQLTILETTAADGNAIISCIADNLLDNEYEREDVYEYIMQFIDAEQLAENDILEILGQDPRAFYVEHEKLVNLLTRYDEAWDVKLSEAILGELFKLSIKIK